MPGFTRKTLLAWLQRHRGKRIVLHAERSALSLAGVCEGLEELDACSTEFMSCNLRLATPGAEAALTLHETALAVHVLLRDPASGRTEVSLPVTLPYGDVIVALEEEASGVDAAKAGAPKSAAAEKRRRKPESPTTPYRLLH